MSQASFQVRRAIVDDLPGLVPLWESMRLSREDLERRLTEFQVVVDPDGRLLGTVALELSGRHGRLHSEGFTDFALSDQLRPLLWERMQSVAANHGLVRVWTQETAPFWRQNGLHAAEAAELDKLPSVWKALPSGWLTMQLRDEAALEMTLEKEFARFKELEKAATGKVLRRARMMKFLATLLAVILAIFVGIFSVYMLKNHLMLFGSHP